MSNSPQPEIIACSAKQYQGNSAPTTFFANYDGTGYGGVERLPNLGHRMVTDYGVFTNPKLICGVDEGHVNSGTDSGGKYEFRGLIPSEESQLLDALRGK
jgi:hypothetical protein